MSKVGEDERELLAVRLDRFPQLMRHRAHPQLVARSACQPGENRLELGIDRHLMPEERIVAPIDPHPVGRGEAIGNRALPRAR